MVSQSQPKLGPAMFSPPLGWPSPFVSLTALSALILLLVPNELLLNVSSPGGDDPMANNQNNESEHYSGEELFSCGGGPFSSWAASTISISCDRHSIHLCCEVHDYCYEQHNVSQAHCDDAFCACLSHIHYSSYCSTIAQPGLCLATRTFGHLFHWSANCTAPAVDGTLPDECRYLEQISAADVVRLGGQ